MNAPGLREPAPLLECATLLLPLHQRLMALLESLDAAGWQRPTVAGAWRVRDVAAHLLDGQLRKLSFHRDGLTPPAPSSHHQQQIRLAVGAPLLEEPEFLRPLLDVSVRALPRAYATVDAPEGTCVTLTITGGAGGSWTLRREAGRWRLYEGHVEGAAAAVRMDEGFAWRLFFKAMPEAQRRSGLRFTGDAALADPMAGTLAVMA